MDVWILGCLILSHSFTSLLLTASASKISFTDWGHEGFPLYGRESKIEHLTGRTVNSLHQLK